MQTSSYLWHLYILNIMFVHSYKLKYCVNTLHPYNMIYISYITYNISIYVSIQYLSYSSFYISSCKPSCSERIIYIPLTPMQNGLSVNTVLFSSVLFCSSLLLSFTLSFIQCFFHWIVLTNFFHSHICFTHPCICLPVHFVYTLFHSVIHSFVHTSTQK